MKRLLDRFDGALGAVEFVVIAVCSVAALGLGVWHVVARYVFNTGVSWSEAIFVVLTIAGMLFAGSRGVRDDTHVRVDVVPRLLGTGAQRALRILAHAVSFALCAYLFYCGVLYLGFVRMMGTVSPDTQLPDWVVYALVPITMGLFALRYLMLIAREAGGEATGRGHGEGAAVPPSPTALEGRS